MYKSQKGGRVVAKKENRYVTLKDVAAQAGTSVGTVSYVLSGNKDRYVSTHLRQRIEQAAKELHYVRCAPASALRGKPRGIIAVTVPQFTNIFFSRIILAIEKVMVDHGYILSVCNTFEDDIREKNVLDIMLSQHFDGFILIPTKNGYENCESLRMLNLPYVVVERPFTNAGEPYDFVSLDNYCAGRVAAAHLVENGHKKIGFVRWNSFVANLSHRLNAYRDVLEENGIENQESLVAEGEFSLEAGYALTKQLLQSRPDLTAIIFEEHVMAQGGVRYLHDAGIRIPEDLSVVVIGYPEWVRSNNPTITSVTMEEDAIGTFAATTLLQKMEGTAEGGCVHKEFPCRLAPGKSVKKI